MGFTQRSKTNEEGADEMTTLQSLRKKRAALLKHASLGFDRNRRMEVFEQVEMIDAKISNHTKKKRK